MARPVAPWNARRCTSRRCWRGRWPRARGPSSARLPMPDELGLLLLIAGIAFLGSLVYGITGFGSSLVTIPLAIHFVPLPFALAVFALMDLANALRLGLQHPGDAAKSEILRMVPLVLVGTTIGVTLLVNLPRAGAMLALGG